MKRSGILALAAFCLLGSPQSPAQDTAVDTDLKRLSGHWRIIKLVEDGRSIPESQMTEWLPGGGALEIVDYTILFKSPVDGSKSSKTFRIDPTVFPSRVAIQDRDTATGVGIYKFEGGKLILCISRDKANLPTDFSAPAKSARTMMVLERFDASRTDTISDPVTLNRGPIHDPAPAWKIATPNPVPVPALPAEPAPTPPATIVTESVAGTVLTDAQVAQMLVGKWRMQDGQGSVDLFFDQNSAFRSYRYVKSMANFQVIFTPTPVSSGTWSVTAGRLNMNIATSIRASEVNHTFSPSVRSISAKDLILVDHLGRVSRAVKTP